MFKRLENKKIAMLGWGVENQALTDFLLAQKLNCAITVCDARENLEKTKTEVAWRLGKGYDSDLKQFDIVFRVPGYPLFSSEIARARQAGTEISSPTKLFFEFSPTRNIIGVTGTKGKGTTSTLIKEIMKAAGKEVFFGGNIGIPIFDFFNKIKAESWVVLELSSFQLEDLETSPYIAVFTNFTREHLAPADPLNPNYHKRAVDYWRAKTNIFKWQKEGDYLIANQSLKSKIEKQIFRSEAIYFGKTKLKTFLPGEHNRENIAAAEAVAKLIGIKSEISAKAVEAFLGLEHRIEFVAEKKGVKYYNDTFATTPEAAITALKSFSESIVLLVGGADKGSDFKNLAKEIKKKVKFAVLLDGKATGRIKKELLKADFGHEKMKLACSLEEAMKMARSRAIPGEVVLLSPACASFGMFKNYKERGKMFKELVFRF